MWGAGRRAPEVEEKNQNDRCAAETTRPSQKSKAENIFVFELGISKRKAGQPSGAEEAKEQGGANPRQTLESNEATTTTCRREGEFVQHIGMASLLDSVGAERGE